MLVARQIDRLLLLFRPRSQQCDAQLALAAETTNPVLQVDIDEDHLADRALGPSRRERIPMGPNQVAQVLSIHVVEQRRATIGPGTHRDYLFSDARQCRDEGNLYRHIAELDQPPDAALLASPA